jgi:hypothetical protein
MEADSARDAGTRMRLLPLIAVCCTLFAPVLRADRFELKDGGELVGSVIDRGDSGVYVVRTADGAEISIDRRSIQRIVQQDEAAIEYQRKSRAMPDTGEAHRELAEWCRARKLLGEADHHLARVAELNPDDEEARRSLGYQRVGNRWLTSDQVMAERGMIFFDGKYRTRQDAALRERDKKLSTVNIDWFQQIRHWRGQLDNRRPERVAEAQAHLLAINDPQAAPALIRVMEAEEDEVVFDFFLRILAQLDHPAALQQLVGYALDPGIRAEVRAQARDYIVRWPRPAPIVPFVEALKSKDNKVVNLAGLALHELNNPDAISPLIDALVTTHKFIIQPEGNGQQINTGMFSGSGGVGGGGLNVGGNAPKVISQDLKNEKVHQALMRLSGNQKFEYDEAAWRAWYVDMQMRKHVNARRDE